MANDPTSRPVQVVSRAGWGARPPRTLAPITAVRGLAVHYSGMDADEHQDHARCAERVRGIQRYHQDANGWADIAYSWVACKHGVLFEGRGAKKRTAANGTDAGNARFLAVCFLGDDSAGRDDVTDAGRAAIRHAWALTKAAWPGAVEVVPHSQFKPTSCPGDELRAWLSAGMPGRNNPQEVGDVDQKYLDAIARTDAATDALPNVEHGVAYLCVVADVVLELLAAEHPDLVRRAREKIADIPLRG